MNISLEEIKAKKNNGQKIVALTAYDHSLAQVLDKSDVDIILVGDSLGMVIQGNRDTLSVTTDDISYHTAAVSRACQHSYLMADMPAISLENDAIALKDARQIIKSGAKMVKVEGLKSSVIKNLVSHNIPVCGHVGLEPQSIEKIGGFKVQGRTEDSAQKIIDQSKQLQELGVGMLVLECIPFLLAKKISESLTIPTIGIGAGPDCDGQILVTYDLLGIGKKLKFSKTYLGDTGIYTIPDAVKKFGEEVRASVFPSLEQSFDY